MGGVLQAVDHGAALSSVVLLLPFVHLMNQFEEGALGNRCVPVHWPAQELKLLHHAVPVLRLGAQREQRGQNEHRTQTHPNLNPERKEGKKGRVVGKKV